MRKHGLGDVVRLNSGGPEMVVVTIGTDDRMGKVECTWIAHGEARSVWFPDEALTPILKRSDDGCA